MLATTYILSPWAFLGHVWILPYFLLVSPPVGLGLNFLSTLLSQSPFSCFQNDFFIYCFLSFFSCLCGFIHFEYFYSHFSGVSGESGDKLMCSNTMFYYLFLKLLLLFWGMFFENSKYMYFKLELEVFIIPHLMN